MQYICSSTDSIMLSLLVVTANFHTIIMFVIVDLLTA